MDGNSIGDEGAIAIAKYLMTNQQIELLCKQISIGLHNNRIKEKGIIEIAKALVSCKQLTYIGSQIK